MRWRVLGILVAAMVAVPAGGAAQDVRPGVAVLPFDNGGSYGQEREDFEALQIGLQQMLLTELAVNRNLRVVGRGRLRELMREQDLGASGRVDPATAARIGRLVGAHYVIVGGFVDFYGDFRMDARIVNVETGEIVKSERVRDRREQLYDLVVGLASQLTRGVDLPPLPRQAYEERRRRDVPEEAVRLYTKALLYQDRGDTTRAVQLLNQVKTEFPAYSAEADEALQRIQRG